MLEKEINKLSSQAEALEQAQKFKNLATWRRNIQSSMAKKVNGFNLSAAIRMWLSRWSQDTPETKERLSIQL